MTLNEKQLQLDQMDADALALEIYDMCNHNVYCQHCVADRPRQETNRKTTG